MAKIVHSLTDLVTPKPTALIPVANGSEEIELVVLSNVLARAGVRVTIAAVSDDPDHIVTLMKGTMITGDKAIEHCGHEEYDLIVVPGGSGAKILGANSTLAELLRKQKEAGKLYGGICAAPVDVLLRHAIVTGPMTCFPGYREQAGQLFVDEAVVVSDNCVTSQGPGTAMAMALKLVELLRGEKIAQELSKSIGCRKNKQ
uniref:DJ-1/PfpI domain-containing protein n=1 Tax=Globisporangium ultimum (strain ATCC 200006 / CBS 805.95 / DAOM BR144) TaxID=431595 RepID=K3X676_GLOUD